MAPNRRKGSARATAAADAVRKQWKIGDLVLAKMKGFPAWPAMISEPEKWGFSSDRKKHLVYFYGTKQIAFCNYADIEAFTEEKKKSLLIKRQGKGADFVRAVEEIIDVYESLKKQSLTRNNFNDGCNASNQDHLEDSRVDCFGKTAEPSLSPSLNLQSNGPSVSVCGYKVNVDCNPGALLDVRNHNKNAVVDDSAKKISILDQLRQIPLSSIPTTRRRVRDSLLPSPVIKSASSHRRSRSSLVNNPCKSQKSSMQVDAKLDVDCSVSDILLEEPTPKEQVVVRGEHLATCSAEASSISSRVPLEDILAVKSQGTNSDDGSVLEFNGKFERSDNDTGSNTFPDGDASQNSKTEIPSNTPVIKARRKSYRKKITDVRTCVQMGKEFDMQGEGGNLSDSSNSKNGITDTLNNADGDGHLPLVKRARVRMGEQPVEEENLNEYVGSKVKLDNLVNSNGHCGSTTFSCTVKNCLLQNGPPKRTSPVTKEFTRSSTNGFSHNNTGGDLLSCNTNKHHLMLDVEAALPPSKRLHRALEAMSANAAEAAIDCPQTRSETETKSSDCLGSSTENEHHVDESVRCPRKQLHMQPSVKAAFDSTCDLSSSLTSQNLLVCCLTSSEVKPDDTNPGNVINSYQENSKEIVAGRSFYHSSFTSKITDTSHTSLLELVEKHSNECRPNYSCSHAVEKNDVSLLGKECAYSEGVRVSPKAADTCNSQQFVGLSPSGGASTAMSTTTAGAATAMSITTTVCTASEIDGVVVGSDVNVDLSVSDMNGIPSVSSGTNVCSLSSDMIGAAAASGTTNFSSTANNTSMATICSRSHFEQHSRVRHMQNVVLEVEQTPKNRSILSKLAPIKDLIAAAQAKRYLSRSTSLCDSAIDGKIVLDTVVSPTLINKEDSSGRGSPSNPMFCHRPASDDGTCYLQNGSRTPLDGSTRKGFNKYMNHSEANAARRCFESLLCTLSRTKESIGRATRLAIDCAKYGIAGEVIDILLQYLEKESSLHRRVDLFFLVDSITQCSRCQKGGPGDVYPSLVQAVLPRLLSAAAPPGNAASENRRQCLKVLRLWLERKTLPEFTVRHHIRELEYGSEVSLTISYSRRPSRTERPLNDPVREMEGMLVDEYGSNASFQLPQFLNTRILEDDEGSGSDEKSFEAVTPDMNAEIDCEKRTTPKSAEKHRLVLEDVDGELEMEDVAPPCGHEAIQSNTCHIKVAEMVSNFYHKCDQNNLLSFAPPLPEERPPSPPPLPTSPPPVVPSSSSAIGSEMSSYSEGRQQMPHPVGNNCQSVAKMLSGKKVYHLQPPPPVVSNQFSYIQQAQSQVHQSSYSERLHHHAHDIQRDNFYGDVASRKSVLVDVSDRSTFYPSVCAGPSGLAAPDKVESPIVYGPRHHDPPSAPCQDWPYPHRTSSYSVSASKTSLENPVSGVSGAPAYWRAR